MKRETSFGTLEILLERDGKVLSEFLTFAKEGRPHSHDEWEHCYITKGKGIIMVGDQKRVVGEGEICKIPPHTPHWMIPTGDTFELLLVYSSRED